jgi:hypothetical protein
MPTVTTCLKDVMTDFNDGKETTPWGTQRTKMGSNDVNMAPMALALFNTSKTKSKKTIEIQK